MPLLNWDTRYSVGIPAMDAQHQRLVALLNGVHEALRSGAGSHTLGDALEDMLLYARTHFSAEESLMREGAYSDLQSHQESHAAVVDKAATFLSLIRTGEAELNVKHLHFLREWLTTHLLQEDVQYGAALSSAVGERFVA